MNCANHSEQTATGFCRSCGKPLCPDCQRPAHGTLFCEEHFPVMAEGFSQTPGPQTPPPSPPPWPPPPPAGPGADNPWTNGPALSGLARISPGLAFILGFIPGVGAVYNGQYAKGVIHAVVFGVLVSIESSGAAPGMEPLFGILIALWTFYMAFEAYHTAARRQRGEAVDEFSSILPMHGQPGVRGGFPAGPLVMIALGIVFLLNTLELVRLREILRFWPVFLIALGGYMLWVRVAGPAAASAQGDAQEVGRD